MAGTDTFNDKAIGAALKRAADTGKGEKLPDGAGLRLDVQPSGAGWWRLRYRFGGREGMLSLGVYPEVTLSLASQRRDKACTLIAASTDPSAARKADKVAQAASAEVTRMADAGLPGPGSFEAVARDWLTAVHGANVSAGHAERTRIRLEQDAFPWIGRRQIAEMDAPELLATLRRVMARGAIATAHRLKDACGQVFRYGIATGVRTRNPAADLRDALPPVPTRHLAAVVDPKQAGELLRAMGDYAGRFVFPSLQTKDRPMSENTVNVALRRMGFDRETATAHGFRATARTMAAERLGIAPEVIEAQLAHAVGDALGRAYNRTTFSDQRRELMTKWADYLDRLRKGADVVALPSRAA
jgi:hypothetical protein